MRDNARARVCTCARAGSCMHACMQATRARACLCVCVRVRVCCVTPNTSGVQPRARCRPSPPDNVPSLSPTTGAAEHGTRRPLSACCVPATEGWSRGACLDCPVAAARMGDERAIRHKATGPSDGNERHHCEHVSRTSQRHHGEHVKRGACLVQVLNGPRDVREEDKGRERMTPGWAGLEGVGRRDVREEPREEGAWERRNFGWAVN